MKRMFTDGQRGFIGYVLMGFPRVSETFIASERHRVGADIARAREALGWEPATDVRAEFEWVLEHSRTRHRAAVASG